MIEDKFRGPPLFLLPHPAPHLSRTKLHQSTAPVFRMSGIPSFNQRGPQRLSLTTIRNVEGRTMQDLCLVNFEAFRQLLDIVRPLYRLSEQSDAAQDREADAWQLTKALCCEDLPPFPPFQRPISAHRERLRRSRRSAPRVQAARGPQRLSRHRRPRGPDGSYASSLSPPVPQLT